jgi:hypothetical protein
MTHSTVKPPTVDDDDDLTEILFMKSDRVDMVGGPANAPDFLLAKSAQNPSLFTEAFVERLAKSAQEGDMTARKTAPADEATEPLKKDTLDPGTLLETPDVDAAGDPTDPGSPAYEAVDAVRAGQAIDFAVALKRLVEVAIERESQEALVGDDPDDAENVWNLQDVSDMVDCILGVLAPYQVAEQAEADGREADDTLILKSGRVLSGANESNIRQAMTLLETVVSTLPLATDDALIKSEPAEDAVSENLSKAAGDPQILVYGPEGAAAGPLGSINADNLTTFAAPPTPADDSEAAPADASTEAPTAPADDAASTDGADAAAAAAPAAPADPADGEVIPGTDTVQAPADGTEDVKKGLVTDFQSALVEALEPFAKQLGVIPDLAGALETLQKRVDTIGKLPDDRTSPRFNGATGAGLIERGAQEDELTVLQKAVDAAPDEEAKMRAQSALLHASIRSRFAK